MSVDAYIFNGRDYYLVHLTERRHGIKLDGIRFSTRESFENDSQIYISIAIEHLYAKQCNIGLIYVEENFLRTFNNGIIRNIYLEPLKMYTSQILRNSNNSSFRLDYIFQNELPAILAEKNMDIKYIKTYLNPLRQSLVEMDDDVEIWLKKNNVERDVSCDPCDQIIDIVRNLSNRAIAAIIRCIMSNRLNCMVTPNILYYNEMNKIQQSALSIKKSKSETKAVKPLDADEITDDDDEEELESTQEEMDVDIDEREDRIINISDLECDKFGRPKITFLPNVHMYIFPGKYFLVRIELTHAQLEYLIQRFMVVAYMSCGHLTSNKMIKILHMVVDSDNMHEFTNMKINRKTIEFIILDENFDMKSAPLCFSKLPKDNFYKVGCPIDQCLVNFNNEQNAIKSKYIEVAARVCPHILELLCRKYKISFKVKRTLQRTDRYFIFYEILFYVNKFYIEEILTLVYPNYSQEGCTHQCFMLADEQMKDDRLANDKFATAFDACWMQVPCFYIYYHTFFSFFLRYISSYLSLCSCPHNTFCQLMRVDPQDKCVKALVKINPLFKMTIYNYTMFEYIKTMGTSTISRKESNSLFSSILMAKVQMLDRDIISPFVDSELVTSDDINTKQRALLRKLNVRFVEFSGVEDGPMISAISIRSCEQMRKNSSLADPRKHGTNVVNYNMLINNTQQGGQEAGQTNLYI